MRNETDRDTIEQATVLYLTEKTAATIYGSWRDINRVSDAAYKVADACERAYQDSGAYEDKKQSLRWRVTAEQWHYKNNIDYSHRSAYRARVKAYNRFVRKNGELGIIIAGPTSHILCALTVIAVTAITIANTIFAHMTH